MSFKNNKIIILLLLGIVFWQFYINLKKPEANIAERMLKAEKTSYTGHKIFNNYEEVPITKKDKRSYYSSSDLQKMIYKSKPNDTIILDKDVYLKFAIFIDKPLIIKSDNFKRKILGKNIASMFMINANDLKLENLDFYLIDTLFFIQSDTNNKIEPLRSNLSIINSTITLEGNSNNLIRMNNLLLDNVSVKNKTTVKNSDCALLEYYGTPITIKKSSFIDFNNSCVGSVRLRNLESAKIEDSLFIGFPFGMNGVVSFDKSKKITLSNNIFLDLNREFRENVLKQDLKNQQNVDDEDTDLIIGSIGISLYDSEASFISKNLMLTDNAMYSDIPASNLENAETFINDEFLTNVVTNSYKINCSSWKEVLAKIGPENILNSFCIK